MNINDIIQNRRATPPRFLAKKEISKDIIQHLLENANWAPNHKMNSGDLKFIPVQKNKVIQNEK